MFSKCKSAPKLGELENSSKWMEPSPPHNDNWCWTLGHPFIYCDICNLGSLGCTWVLTFDITTLSWHCDITSTLDLCSAEWSSNVFVKTWNIFSLQFGMYFNQCGETKWRDAGFRHYEKVCCDNGKYEVCPWPETAIQHSLISTKYTNILIPYSILSLALVYWGFTIFVLPNCH